MLRRRVILPAVRGEPRHDLLVVARTRAHGIADSGGGVVEGGEVAGLAEAGPDCLGGGGGAAACLLGLGEEGAVGGAGGELGVAVGEELGGGVGGDEGGEEETSESVEAHVVLCGCCLIGRWWMLLRVVCRVSNGRCDGGRLECCLR